MRYPPRTRPPGGPRLLSRPTNFVPAGNCARCFAASCASVQCTPGDMPRRHADIRASCRSGLRLRRPDRKSTRLNSSHLGISYAVFCLKKKNVITELHATPEQVVGQGADYIVLVF